MPNVGTLSASMYLDTAPYVAGLNQAAGATRSFQQGMSTISFAGFNRGIFATTTLLYGLERIMSSMSKGMEEYSNILGRIGTVADLTAASVSALAESMASLSVYQGVSRTDIMQGMYTAAQAGFQSPAEMRAMATSGAVLSRASGKEINVKKAVDLQSGIRQALGIGMNSVTSNRMNDILLKGRDVGRWELDQMAEALGKPATVWGNQYAGKQSGEETLRQLLTVMSTASLAGISPSMTATGTRRIIERTLQLNNTKRGDPLRQALRGVGFTGPNAIENALDQGGIKYLNTLSSITRGGESNELNKLGYGAKDLMVITAAMRGGGEKLNQAYQEISYGNAAGTTGRYGEKMRGTYDYTRDRLRSEWQITSQQFMQATIPLIGQFVNMLEMLNGAAQMLPDSVKSFMLLIGALAGLRLSLNLFGFRGGILGNVGKVSAGGVIGGTTIGASSVARSALAGTSTMPTFTRLSQDEAQIARLTRRQVAAAGRPYSRYLTPQASPIWQNTSSISGSSAPSSLSALGWLARQPKYGIVEEMRMEALRNRYAPITSGGIPVSSSKYGPTLEQRIRWAAYKRGESVYQDDAGNFTGGYGSLSPAASAYLNRGVPQGPMSANEWRIRQLYSTSLPGYIPASEMGGSPTAIPRGFAPYGTQSRTGYGYSPNARGLFSGVGNSVGSGVGMAIGSMTGSNLEGENGNGILPIVLSMAGMKVGANLADRVGSWYSGLNPGQFVDKAKKGLSFGRRALPGTVASSLFLKAFNARNWDMPINADEEASFTERETLGARSGSGAMRFLRNVWQSLPALGSIAANSPSKWGAGENYNESWGADQFSRIWNGNAKSSEGVFGDYVWNRLSTSNRKYLAANKMGNVDSLMKSDTFQTGVRTQFGDKVWKQLSDENFQTTQPQKWADLMLDSIKTLGGAADIAKQKTDALASSETELAGIRSLQDTNIRPYLGFTSGMETMMGLEAHQRQPFQPEPSAKWVRKYYEGYGKYASQYNTDRYNNEDLQVEIDRMNGKLGKRNAKVEEKPYRDVMQWNDRLSGMDFLARQGPNLGKPGWLSDATIIKNANLDAKNMDPELTASILAKIRNLDYTDWTQTFSQSKAPFTQALQYGTKEGYNATLERKDTDPIVQILSPQLKAIIDAIVATETNNKQKQDEFTRILGDTITNATRPIVEAIENLDLDTVGFPGVDGQ